VSLDCYYGPLEASEAEGYRAAGILLLRQKPVPYYEATTYCSAESHVQVLCCAEIRNKKKNDTVGPLQLSLLGGKIEDTDGQDARVTAAREFWEETGGIVPLEACQGIVGLITSQDFTSESLPVWCGHAKYVLYVVYEQDPQQQIQWDNLPSRHSEALRFGGPDLPKDAEASHLIWVDWKLIKDKLNKNSRSQGESISFFVPSDNVAQPERHVVPFSIHAKFTFANPTVQQGIDTFIQKVLQLDVGAPSKVAGGGMEEAVAGMENLRV
jgi:8-oxo-dGTP pyrophosphatase MutT (NUDIX family)